MKASEMEYQTEQEVMTCPACGLSISAQVSVKVALGPLLPDLSASEMKVDATGRISRFVLAHRCMGRVEVSGDADPAPSSPVPGEGVQR